VNPTDRINLRVLIVAEHATANYGGEAVLPLHYFRLLRARGVEAWLVVHARNRDELLKRFPDDAHRIHFVPDTRTDRFLFRVYEKLPAAVGNFTVLWLQRMLSQFHARRVARHWVIEHRIDVLHQPIPVSPKETSVLYDMGAPVIIGPMNGGMSHPPGFEHAQGKSVRAFMRIGRWLSDWIHRAIPGKRRAATLVVANARTRAALPSGCRGRVITLVENGVDLSLWTQKADATEAGDGGPVRFVFAGRLVDWKGVHFLISAMPDVRKAVPDATLEIIGDGPDRERLERRREELQLADAIEFRGWLTQPAAAERLRAADVFVLPSLYESGGAVVLEAMASGLPVIATDWGGPADYLDPSCGVLVPPTPGTFDRALANSMIELARDPQHRRAMGRAGREKVMREYDWERKIEQMLKIYAETAGGKPSNG
jgi:glycosyltransferase involved in cell wall biosynthesis